MLLANKDATHHSVHGTNKLIATLFVFIDRQYTYIDFAHLISISEMSQPQGGNNAKFI